jgi:hypothetical protein
MRLAQNAENKKENLIIFSHNLKSKNVPIHVFDLKYKEKNIVATYS